MTNLTFEKFSNIFGPHIDVESYKVLEEKIGIEKTMDKILSLINGEEKDKSDLGSLVNDFYDRYQALYSRYDDLIWKLEKISHNKGETGIFSSDVTPTDAESSDLKIHGSSYSAEEHNKICEGKLGEDVQTYDEHETEVEMSKPASTLTAENEDLKYEKSMVLNKLGETEKQLQECKNENEGLREMIHLLKENAELQKEYTNQCQKRQLLERKSEPLSTKDQIQGLTKKASSSEQSKAVDKAQLEAWEQVQISQKEFESDFMEASKNLVKSLQNISVVISNQLFEEDRLFEDQFLEICKNVVFSLEKIKVSDQQHQTIRELQKACQDQKMEISKLVKRHKEMSEKIEACEAKKEGDDKEIKELSGQVQTLEEKLSRCNQRLKNIEAEYEEKEGNHRSMEDYLRMKCKHLEEQSEIHGKDMTKIKDLLSVWNVDTLDDMLSQMDSAVKKKCGHIQTKLSKLSEELQRVKKMSAALCYEKQERDQEATRMLEEMVEPHKIVREKCRQSQTKISKSSEEIRVKERSAAVGYENQEMVMEELKKRLREKEEEERFVREEMEKLKKRVAEKEEEGRRMKEEMEEVEKRVREKDKEGVQEEMGERERKLREKEEEGRLRQEAMEEWEKSVTAKEEEVMVMIDKKREAIRQLNMLIEYHRGQLRMLIEYHWGNYNRLRQVLNS